MTPVEAGLHRTLDPRTPILCPEGLFSSSNNNSFTIHWYTADIDDRSPSEDDAAAQRALHAPLSREDEVEFILSLITMLTLE